MVCSSCHVRAATVDGLCLACALADHVPGLRVPPCDHLLPRQLMESGVQTERVLMDTALHVHDDLRLRHLVRYLAHQQCLAARDGKRYLWTEDTKLSDVARQWLATNLGRS